MAKNHPDKIRFPKPRPRLMNRFGFSLVFLSGIYALVTYFLKHEHFAVEWGPFLALPFGLLGLYLAGQRRSQILQVQQKELIQVKQFLGMPVSKKTQSLQDFTRLRLSEEQIEIDGESKPLYCLFLEGKVSPALLTSFSDKNEATQKLKSIAKMVELPISWPQV